MAKEITILLIRDKAGTEVKLSDDVLSNIEVGEKESDTVLAILNELPSGYWKIDIQQSDKKNV